MGAIAEEEAGLSMNGRGPPNLELQPQRVDLAKDSGLERDSMSPTGQTRPTDGRRRARQRSHGLQGQRDSLEDFDSQPLLDEQNP